LSNPIKTKNYWILFPVLGIATFIILYIIATFLYPGGSDADHAAKGFNWFNNYWCDLVAAVAKNGENNNARPVAMCAMIILCVSLSVFWYFLPRLFNFNKFGRNAVQFSGIASMAAIVLLLFSNYHDTIINIAALLGTISLICTFRGLYKARYLKTFSAGLLCIILIAINNFIYYTYLFILYLPVIQKITFLIFLLWVSAINLQLYRKLNIFQRAAQ